jgi:ferrous iron transport protein B
VEAVSRYKWIGSILNNVISRSEQRQETWSDKLDKVLTHRLWGFVFFLLLMFSLFISVLFVAEPFKWLLDEVVFAWIANQVDSALAEGPLKSLILKGIIGGVGTVLTFLPQIFALFFFIAILEDCGYMARAAYLMDRIMSKIGLNGKSFIPLLSSYACAIPGIMGARVIENPRDRLITILVAPLMTCSARLPVYALLITTFIPGIYLAGFIPLQAVVMVSMYALGIITAVCVAFLLKKTILHGKTTPFVMELPMYKMPSMRTVFFRMFDQGLAFVYRAGTLILAVSVLVWAAAYYPHNSEAVPKALLQREHSLLTAMEKHQLQPESEVYVKATQELQHVRNEIEGAYLEASYLGRAGKTIEPIVKPLGWDWRIGCAAIASFPAREVIVATLGVIFNLGEEVDENSTELQDSLQNANWSGSQRKLFTIPVALSVMVFFALCAQCVSTLAVIRRETNSYFWPTFTFVYMTVLAYAGAFLTYQIGSYLS